MKKNFLEYPPELATAFVAEQEGFREKAYQCAAGIWTVGFGHTADVEPDDVVTNFEAQAMLEADLKDVVDRLSNYIQVPVTKGQFIALVSLAFNVGVRSVAHSKLLAKLNGGEPAAAAVEFLDWDRARGRVLPGLTKRRKAEHDLFLEEA